MNALRYQSMQRALLIVVILFALQACTIDPAIPPKMMREIRQTMPVCHGETECDATMRSAKRWIMKRGNPWDVGERIKDGHDLPAADTMLAFNEKRIVLVDWHRTPGAYFAYWILHATIFGAQREIERDGEHIGLRYTYHFRGRAMQRVSTDYDARMSWGKTVLAFNRYVREAASTSEPDATRRAEALMRIRRLEQSPLGGDADEDRKWLMSWLLEDPLLDHARYCMEALGPEWRLTYGYAREVETQMLFASVSPWLESSSENDNGAAYVAGIESALNVYQSVLRAEPEARQPALELLLATREEGKLREHLLGQAFVVDGARCGD